MNHYSKKIVYSFFFAISLLSISCKTVIVDENKKTEIEVVELPKIAFVTYKISREQSGNSIALTEVIMAKGKIKNQENNKAKTIGNYELIQLDKNGNELAKTQVINPLNQTVEYIKDNGELAKKDLTFQSKETSIRVQIQPKTHYLLLQEIGNESKNYLKTKL